MRRIITLVTVTAVAIALTAIVRAPADAAAGRLRVVNKPVAQIGWNSMATITPRVKKSAKVRIVKRKVTAYQNGRVVARGRKVALPVGTYRVRMAVTWKASGKTHTTRRSLPVNVVQGACATAADYRQLTADPAYSAAAGDSVAAVGAKLRSSGTVGERTTVATRIASLQEIAGIAGTNRTRNQTHAIIAQLSVLAAKGVQVREDRIYPGCGGAIKAYAAFADGELIGVEAF